MQSVSLISRWRGWFKPSRTNGTPAVTLSTPNRFSRWEVVLSSRDGHYQVVNDSHKVVADCEEEDDALSIVATHNKLCNDREEWYGA